MPTPPPPIEAAEVPLASRQLLALGFVLVSLELILNLVGSYGIFIDEFYYVACSEHLAAGYVDHPPLAIWLLRLSRALFGDSQLALRVLPALAGGATVVLTGMMARRFGARERGQLLAGVAIFAAPIPLMMFGFYSVNAFELVLWTAGAYALVEQARREDHRGWLAFGVIAGLGVLTKHTFVLFGFGLLVGMLLTRARSNFVHRHVWIAVALALLIVSPNLAWQLQHDWLSLDFYAGAEAKNVVTPMLEVVVQQILFMNPVGALIWVPGVAFLLGSKHTQRWRHLGYLFVLLFVLVVVSQRSRPDRIAGAYPIVFAAGAAWWERWSRERARWVPIAIAGSLSLALLPLAPIVLPVLAPARLAPYAAALGVVPEIEAGGKDMLLPQWFDDRLNWQTFVDEVARVTEQELDEVEREEALVLADNYGLAGALELLGQPGSLPPVVSTHNNYFLWSAGAPRGEVLIAVGLRRELLEQIYEEVELVSELRVEYGLRGGVDIFVCRRSKRSLSEVWEQLRNFR